jgi:hypothetical protein
MRRCCIKAVYSGRFKVTFILKDQVAHLVSENEVNPFFRNVCYASVRMSIVVRFLHYNSQRVLQYLCTNSPFVAHVLLLWRRVQCWMQLRSTASGWAAIVGRSESPANWFWPDWWKKESATGWQYIGRATQVTDAETKGHRRGCLPILWAVARTETFSDLETACIVTRKLLWRRYVPRLPNITVVASADRFTMFCRIVSYRVKIVSGPEQVDGRIIAAVKDL